VRASGGKAGNITLKRELEWLDDDYWPIRDRLVDAGRLALTKGKSGGVRVIATAGAVVPPVPPPVPEAGNEGQVPPAPAQPEPPQPAVRIDEGDLYVPMAQVLKTDWARDNRFRELVVEITARQGPRNTGGRWSRPDITVVSSTTLMFYPSKIFDVTTFEIKPAYDFNVTAVYEALAHRRGATRSYVLVQIPIEEQGIEQTSSVIDQMCADAKRHGVGVLIAANPADYDTWDEKVEALRVEADPVLMNDFISVQLSGGAKDEIAKWFR
jgi:hypothetical protein